MKLFKVKAVLLVLTFLIPVAANSQTNLHVPDIELNIPEARVPQTLDEARMRNEIAMREGERGIGEGWNQVIATFSKIYYWSKSFWQRNIQSKVILYWDRLTNFFQEKFSSKKEILREEFEKDKEIAKEETIRTSKSIWQRIKDTINK